MKTKEVSEDDVQIAFGIKTNVCTHCLGCKRDSQWFIENSNNTAHWTYISKDVCNKCHGTGRIYPYIIIDYFPDGLPRNIDSWRLW